MNENQEKRLEHVFKQLCKNNATETEHLLITLQEANLMDEQFVLDWLDTLNEISVTH